MFKKMLFALALVTLTIPAGFAQINSVKTDRTDKVSSPASVSPFVVGERLSYDVSWSDFLVAGELVLETKDRRSFDGIDGFHVTAQAQSVGIVSAFVYKVNDVYDSFINAATLQPFRAEKRSRRGKKRAEASITIDQKARTARYSDGKTIEVPPDTYDMAGLLYAIRAMDLTIGKKRTLTLIEDNKLYTITIEPEGREKITTRAGSYDAVRMTTKSTGGRNNNNLYDLRIYVTNDKQRLPVLITAEPSWGQVRVELTSATGIKNK